jgi:hypothetical protein
MSEVQLGKTTGSLVNALYALESVKVPSIGDGATILSWTDRSPATVIDVQTKGKFVYVTTQDDKYRRVDDNGFSENQKYLYLPNPEGSIRYWRIDQRGEVDRVVVNLETGRWNKVGSGGIFFGRREKYHDFSF